MKNKLKPCINDMCIKNEQSNNSGCSKYFVDQDINTTDIDECPKYITNRPKSAWELYRELLKTTSKDLLDRKLYTPYGCLVSEEKAIEIMQEIERELDK